MDLLKKVSSIFAEVKNYSETKNYYFERHNCSDCGENIKVMLDFTLANENTDKILRFGFCDKCGTLFYHRDFLSKRL